MLAGLFVVRALVWGRRGSAAASLPQHTRLPSPLPATPRAAPAAPSCAAGGGAGWWPARPTRGGARGAWQTCASSTRSTGRRRSRRRVRGALFRLLLHPRLDVGRMLCCCCCCCCSCCVWGVHLPLLPLLPYPPTSPPLPHPLPTHKHTLSGLQDEDLLFVRYESEVPNVLPYFIALDHSRRAVVLAIRGERQQRSRMGGVGATAKRRPPPGPAPPLPHTPRCPATLPLRAPPPNTPGSLSLADGRETCSFSKPPHTNTPPCPPPPPAPPPPP